MRTTDEYILFWNGIYSNFCIAEFDLKIDDISYKFNCSEQAFMAFKAWLFKDTTTFNKILNSLAPQNQKALGRQVRGYDEETWEAYRYNYMVAACLAKFGQNEDLKAELLATGNRILVEASPHDKVWGIGLTEDDPDATNPEKWQGRNLLGIALMEVRDILRRDS